MRSDDHSPDQNVGTGIPTHTCNTVEKSTVLPGYSNLEPIPVPEHTRFRIHMVLPVPVSHLNPGSPLTHPHAHPLSHSDCCLSQQLNQLEEWV
jgi:hypothetical protein